jgi:hypothetical protein
MKKPSLTNSWVIKQSSSEEVCKWFSQYNPTSNAHICGSFEYLAYHEGRTSYEDSNGSLPVITLDQFKEHILGIKPTPSKPVYEIY